MEKLVALDDEIKDQDQDHHIVQLCKQNEMAKHFLEVPGVESMMASIVASNTGGEKGYQSSRDYAANLGVVLKQQKKGVRPLN